MKDNGIHSSFFRMLIILAFFTTINAIDSDIICLRSIKESIEDPFENLSSWDFTNMTKGFVCAFNGIACWHDYENKVLNIRLPNMGLKGSFPTGIKDCKSLTGLDLSRNHLTGIIPSNLADLLPSITTLDLSNNNFSGEIPPSVVNCSYVNVLKLDNNHLTGQIPLNLSTLYRMKVFSVANNILSGPVPIFSNNNNFTKDIYANNVGLCGGPLNTCKNDDDDDIYFFDRTFFSGFIAGFSLFMFLSVLFMFLCWPKLNKRNMRYLYIIIKNIKGRKHNYSQILFKEEIDTEEKKVSSMEKFIRRLSLQELEMATNNFENKNVIGHGIMGLTYKAVFPNDLLLAVKRLHKFENFEKEFLLEIEILGRLRQTNLVPLLGFCFEMEKKFLVYKYMSNGTLHDWLHCKLENKLRWRLRVKIAIGIARGLAWLHHNNVLQVAHVKIRSKCILLDDKFEPKISNFGDAVIVGNGFDFVVLDSGFYREDVYRFGVLLIELVSGKKPSTRMRSQKDRMYEFEEIDKCLMGQGFDEEIYEILRIAENCIQQRDEAINMIQVYQEIREVGISRNEISVSSMYGRRN